MDDRIKHIIESGLMESYLLGECTPDQEQEIDMLLENSDQLKEYLSEIEDIQFAMTESIALEPPKHLKEKIAEAIELDSKAKIGKSDSVRSTGINWSVLALTSALVISLFLFVNSFIRSFELSRELQRAEILLMQHQDHTQDLNIMIDTLQSQLQFLLNEGTAKYPIEARTNNGNLKLMAYWNEELKSSMLQLDELPDLPKDRCLQMWADIKGEMISVAVLSKTTGLMAVPFLADAESLNITVEKAGGSDHPTVANLIANVAI